MGHRIHRESETSSVLKEGIRTKEDYVMFKKFWPSCILKILTDYMPRVKNRMS